MKQRVKWIDPEKTKRKVDNSLLSFQVNSSIGIPIGHSGEMGGLTASAVCPMLDTSTPKLGQTASSVGRCFNRRNRKMWSRAIDGMRLPGRYYFLTLTSTPDSPPLQQLWDGLRKWLKRHRVGLCWLYCFTIEGKGAGVIHMVIRVPHRQKNIDIKALRAMWKERTGASQVVIKRVPESKKADLISYLSNQKVKVGMACELGYQSAVSRWRWSKGWIPKGYGKIKSKMWGKMLSMGVPQELIVLDTVKVLHQMHEKEVKHETIRSDSSGLS